jgi:hypothetical protein
MKDVYLRFDGNMQLRVSGEATYSEYRRFAAQRSVPDKPE